MAQERGPAWRGICGVTTQRWSVNETAPGSDAEQEEKGLKTETSGATSSQGPEARVRMATGRGQRPEPRESRVANMEGGRCL